MDGREQAVRRWFEMWLTGRDTGIGELFAPDALYIESWGPEYHGAEKIKHWFDEWNTRGTVLRWDIGQFLHSGEQSAVTWTFCCRMDNGQEDAFEGVSLITWTAQGRIARLQEFGCNIRRYDPYAGGDAPVFDGQPVLWF